MVNFDGTKYVVRQAATKELHDVLAWLRYEHEEINGGSGGFWCNRKLIEEGFQSGQLLVLVDSTSEESRAFCLGGLVGGGGIFAVHHDWQRQGLGTVLFHHCLEQAKKADVKGLYIQCSPKSSVPFWRNCGFDILDATDGGTLYAVLPIAREFDLPEGCATSQFRIELFQPDDEDKVSEDVTITAAKVSDGEWLLERRFVAHVSTSDVYVRLSKNGHCLSRQKIKYSDHFGFEYVPPFVTLDCVDEMGEQ